MGDKRETLRREIVAQAHEIGARVDVKEEEAEELLDEALSAIRCGRG